MTPPHLVPQFTFDSYVVGPSNRLAAAAARRVADAPGRAYNPLFLHSASGLGKTHLVMAIAQHAARIRPDIEVVYETLERLLEEMTAAFAAGARDEFRRRLYAAELLIVDDVQFLAGRRAAQDELLRAWDMLALRGGQLVLTSDRPPGSIDDIDERLVSRFTGGLIVDVTAPDFETRVAILKRKAEERGQRLASALASELAREPCANVRELQGGLNRVLALQELEAAPPDDEPAAEDEFASFLDDLSEALDVAVADVLEGGPLAVVSARWAEAGMRTQRLDRLLHAAPVAEAAEALIAAFESDAQRLTAIAAEIAAIEADAAELARADILRDPDRLLEAESLLAHVRERNRPLPLPPGSAESGGAVLEGDGFAQRVARAVADAPGGAHNPLFVVATDRRLRRHLLAATANRLRAGAPGLRVAYLSGTMFRAEVIGAIERNVVAAWRARMGGVQALFIEGVDVLGSTERAQEELFHLFDRLHGAGAQLVFGADRQPQELDGLDARLRTRLASGIVVEVAAAAAPGRNGASPAAAAAALDRWFLRRDKVIWDWPDPAAWLVEELD